MQSRHLRGRALSRLPKGGLSGSAGRNGIHVAGLCCGLHLRSASLGFSGHGALGCSSRPVHGRREVLASTAELGASGNLSELPTCHITVAVSLTKLTEPPTIAVTVAGLSKSTIAVAELIAVSIARLSDLPTIPVLITVAEPPTIAVPITEVIAVLRVMDGGAHGLPEVREAMLRGCFFARVRRGRSRRRDRVSGGVIRVGCLGRGRSRPSGRACRAPATGGACLGSGASAGSATHRSAGTHGGPGGATRAGIRHRGRPRPSGAGCRTAEVISVSISVLRIMDG